MLLPFFVGDARHDLFVGGSLLFLFFDLSLLLVTIASFNMLVSLLEERLLKPVLEHFIGGFLLDLFLESLVLLLTIVFDPLLFVLLSLALVPLHHFHILFLSPQLFFSLMPADLLEYVPLGLFDELLFELDLMFFFAHPLLMGNSVARTVTDLAAVDAALAGCT